LIIWVDNVYELRKVCATPFYDPERGIAVCYLGENTFAMSRVRDERELGVFSHVARARIMPVFDPNQLMGRLIREEMKRDAPRLVGKRIKDVRADDDGIDIVLEDGTVLEIVCFGTWSWSIHVEYE